MEYNEKETFKAREELRCMDIKAVSLIAAWFKEHQGKTSTKSLIDKLLLYAGDYKVNKEEK